MAGASGRTSSSRSPGATATDPDGHPLDRRPHHQQLPVGRVRDGHAVAQTAVASQAAAGDDGGALPWAGVVLGGGLIAVFGGAAVARSRRGGGP